MFAFLFKCDINNDDVEGDILIDDQEEFVDFEINIMR